MPARRRETLVVAALLAVLAVAAFGAHLRPGGFYNDDWSYLSTAVYPARRHVRRRRARFDWLSFRPLQMLYWPFAFRVLGTDPSVHAAWLLAIARSWRPWSSGCSGRCACPRCTPASWPRSRSCSRRRLDPVLAGTGRQPARGGVLPRRLIVALRGLRATGRDPLRSHLPAVVLYAASILLYEIAASVIVLTGLLYLAVAGRRGLRPWLVDVVVAGTLLALVTSHTFYDPLSLGDQVDHADQDRPPGPRTCWP